MRVNLWSTEIQPAGTQLTYPFKAFPSFMAFSQPSPEPLSKPARLLQRALKVAEFRLFQTKERVESWTPDGGPKLHAHLYNKKGPIQNAPDDPSVRQR